MCLGGGGRRDGADIVSALAPPLRNRLAASALRYGPFQVPKRPVRLSQTARSALPPAPGATATALFAVKKPQPGQAGGGAYCTT